VTGHGGELVESSSQQGLQRRRPDDQTCSGNVVARRADGGWRREDVDDWRCRRTACNSRPDIVEPCAACTGKQSLRACTGPAQERPASERDTHLKGEVRRYSHSHTKKTYVITSCNDL